jgi:hypothetical protein
MSTKKVWPETKPPIVIALPIFHFLFQDDRKSPFPRPAHAQFPAQAGTGGVLLCMFKILLTTDTESPFVNYVANCTYKHAKKFIEIPTCY